MRSMEARLCAAALCGVALLSWGCRKSVVMTLGGAIEQGDAATVRRLLDSGVDPNSTVVPSDAAPQDALCAAAEKGQHEIVELLLERGAAVGASSVHCAVHSCDPAIVSAVAKKVDRQALDVPDEHGWTPAVVATTHCGGEVLLTLLAAGADPAGAKNLDGESAFRLAFARGERANVPRLLKAGAPLPRPREGEHRSGLDLLLEWAATDGDRPLVEDLLRRGAKGADELLPVAARLGHTAVVEALLPSARRASLGQTLSAAAGTNQQPVAELLVARGAAIEERAVVGAVENGWTFLVERLPRGDRRLRARSKTGDTLAMLAVRRQRPAMIDLLAAKGADLDAPSGKAKTTPLMASVDREHSKELEALLRQKLRWDAADAEGGTALLYAAFEGNERAVAALLQRGADPNHRAEGLRGMTPLLAALERSTHASDPTTFGPVVTALITGGAALDFGGRSTGELAARLARLGLAPSAFEGLTAKWKTGCDGNDIGSCSKLGVLLRALEKPGEAIPLLRRSCDRGTLADCNVLGEVLSDTGHVDEAIRLWKSACDAKDGPACTNLGAVHLEAKRFEEALKVLAPSCDRAYGDACVVLGVAEHRAGDDQAARTTLEKGCKTYPDACRALGELERALGNRARAEGFFAKACEGGVAEACSLQRRIVEAAEEAGAE